MKNILTICWMTIAMGLLSAGPVAAATLEGVNLPDMTTVGDKTLVLNGLGIRKATFLKVKVYVGGLYLEKKSQDPKAILDSKENKRLVMAFVRDVGADKMSEAWDTSLKENCTQGCDALRGRFDTLKSYMGDLKKGELIEFNFLPTGVEVVVSGKKKGVIPGQDFGRQLLMTWLGDHPPNEDLKKGLLGQG